ncbi:MAG: hypothetical protein AAGG01_05810, partial [Planctomycetota bacterium]
MTSTDHPDAVPPSRGSGPGDAPLTTPEAEALEAILRAAMDRAVAGNIAANGEDGSSSREALPFTEKVKEAWMADLRKEAG